MTKLQKRIILSTIDFIIKVCVWVFALTLFITFLLATWGPINYAITAGKISLTAFFIGLAALLLYGIPHEINKKFWSV